MTCTCGPNRECPACIGERTTPKPLDPAKLNFKSPVTAKYSGATPRGRLISGHRSFKAFNDRMGEEGRRERGRKGGLSTQAKRRAAK